MGGVPVLNKDFGPSAVVEHRVAQRELMVISVSWRCSEFFGSQEISRLEEKS